MNLIFETGILLISGFILGEIAEKLNLTRITGYIIAGIALNPDLTGIVNDQFVQNTDPVLQISLALITFSIGGSLSWSKVRATGKTILFLMLFESLSAFIFVFLFVFLFLFFFLDSGDPVATIIAMSLILASLAAPTDPSATLAVIHETKAKGKVSSSTLEIAAFDDVAGIIIYTFSTAFAILLLGDSSLNLGHTLADLGWEIGGAAMTAGVMTLVFYLIKKIFRNLPAGSFIAIVLTLVVLCYGISEHFKFETLLSTMIFGAFVANLKGSSNKIFELLENYTDELMFLIFFTLSGIQLNLSSIQGSLVIILIYIIARIAGKYAGIYSGSTLLNVDHRIKKYGAGGLIPQGGIVIGLALMLRNDPAFADISSSIISIVIGAALVHEIIGPLMSKFSLSKAGEIRK